MNSIEVIITTLNLIMTIICKQWFFEVFKRINHIPVAVERKTMMKKNAHGLMSQLWWDLGPKTLISVTREPTSSKRKKMKNNICEWFVLMNN